MRWVRIAVATLMTAAVAVGCAKTPKMPRLKLDDPNDQAELDNPAWREHVERCKEKHPNYDPLTNSYLDSRGRMRLC